MRIDGKASSCAKKSPDDCTASRATSNRSKRYGWRGTTAYTAGCRPLWQPPAAFPSTRKAGLGAAGSAGKMASLLHLTALLTDSVTDNGDGYLSMLKYLKTRQNAKANNIYSYVFSFLRASGMPAPVLRLTFPSENPYSVPIYIPYTFHLKGPCMA